MILSYVHILYTFFTTHLTWHLRRVGGGHFDKFKPIGCLPRRCKRPRYNEYKMGNWVRFYFKKIIIIIIKNKKKKKKAKKKFLSKI
jgi:hypothetical protein